MGKLELDLDRLAEYRLTAEVGNPYDEDGLTRTDLSGAGRLIIEHHRAGAEGSEPGGQERDARSRTSVTKRYEEDFGRDGARQVFLKATEFPWTQPFPRRPGIPSEPVLEWRLAGPTGTLAALKVWLRDAEKDKVMGPVVSALRQSVERISHGELFL